MGFMSVHKSPNQFRPTETDWCRNQMNFPETKKSIKHIQTNHNNGHHNLQSFLLLHYYYDDLWSYTYRLYTCWLTHYRKPHYVCTRHNEVKKWFFLFSNSIALFAIYLHCCCCCYCYLNFAFVFVQISCKMYLILFHSLLSCSLFLAFCVFSIHGSVEKRNKLFHTVYSIYLEALRRETENTSAPKTNKHLRNISNSQFCSIYLEKFSAAILILWNCFFIFLLLLLYSWRVSVYPIQSHKCMCVRVNKYLSIRFPLHYPLENLFPLFLSFLSILLRYTNHWNHTLFTHTQTQTHIHLIVSESAFDYRCSHIVSLRT